MEAGSDGTAKVSSSIVDGLEDEGVVGATAGEVDVPFFRARTTFFFKGAAGLSLHKGQTINTDNFIGKQS